MSSQISKDFIDQVIEKADLVEIISARVSVKKRGKNYLGCCPFHDEKTPSFNINPIKQFYYCFGCSASGDAITFLMEHDNLTFVEAVSEVASSVGMSIPANNHNPISALNSSNSRSNFNSSSQFKSHAFSGNNKNSKVSFMQSMFALMNQVAKFYQWNLRNKQEDSLKAIEYLKNRGIDGEIAKKFQIGWIGSGWDNLKKTFAGKSINNVLTKKNNSSEIIIINISMLDKAGLLVTSDKKKVYDRFRERLMFPIRDRRGRVVGFGGRVIEKDGMPKYLNSPETMLFSKSKILYGLYESLQSSKDLSRVCVVEGYMDVVGLAQRGVNYAVATLGTATSGDHIRQLLQFTKEIIFCFDGDKAGRSAAWRALNASLPFMTGSFQVKFLFLPDGEDPDSIIKSIGKDGFEKKLDSSQPLSEFLFSSISDGISLVFADGKAVFLDKLLPLLAQVPDGSYKLLLCESASKKLQVSVEQIQSQLSVFKKTPGYWNNNNNADISGDKHDGKISGYLDKLIAYLLSDNILALKIDLSEFNNIDNLSLSGKLLLKLIRFYQDQFGMQDNGFNNDLEDNINSGVRNISIQKTLEGFSDEKTKKKLAELALMNHPFGHEQLIKDFLELMDRFKKDFQLSNIDELIKKSMQGALNIQEKEQLKGLLAKHKLKLK